MPELTKEQVGQMATMGANLKNLSRNFSEFKDETKEFQKTQTAQFKEFSGHLQNLSDFKTVSTKNTDRIVPLEKWISLNGPIVEKIIAREKDNRKRFWDLIWQFGWVVLGVGFMIYTAYINNAQTIEVPNTAYVELTDLLESYAKDQNK